MRLPQRQYLFVLLSVITLTLLLHLGLIYFQLNVADSILLVSRWISMALLAGYGMRKKSLTTWIMVSMVLGVEFGHDLPDVAIHLNLLSKIFLNLIKTIIAPIAFRNFSSWHCRAFEPETDWAHGLEIDSLL
jgi:proton glutamate symport protein